MEDFPIARLFRQSPLNSIWEGSGNVIALDIITRAHRSLPVLMDLVRSAKGRQLKPFDEYVDRLDAMGERATYCTCLYYHHNHMLPTHSSIHDAFHTPMSCHASTVSQLVNAPQSSINSTYNQQSARWMVDQLAVSLQAALLILHGDPVVAELYVRSRLPSCPPPPPPPDHHHHHGKGVPSTTIRGVTYGGTMVYEEQHCAHLIERSMPVFMTS